MLELSTSSCDLLGGVGGAVGTARGKKLEKFTFHIRIFFMVHGIITMSWSFNAILKQLS